MIKIKLIFKKIDNLVKLIEFFKNINYKVTLTNRQPRSFRVWVALVLLLHTALEPVNINNQQRTF